MDEGLDVIEFDYVLSDGAMQMVSNVTGLGRVLKCYLPKQFVKKLRYTSLYVVTAHGYVAETEQHKEYHTYSAPLGIVAMIESEAISLYNVITGSDDSSVYSELVRDCSKLEVN